MARNWARDGVDIASAKVHLRTADVHLDALNGRSWGSLERRLAFAQALQDLESLIEETRELRAAVTSYEHCISWDTTCESCATNISNAYNDYVRADKAERALEDALTMLTGHVAHGHSTDGGETWTQTCLSCGTAWPCDDYKAASSRLARFLVERSAEKAKAEK